MLSLPEKTTPAGSVQDQMLQRQRLLRQLRDNLGEAQNRMVQMANKHKKEVQFKEGDRVILRLQPYRQSSLTDQKFSKLWRRYFGPLKVLKKIGEVAYKVELPESARLHPVFHVSKMKLFHEDGGLHPTPLPTTISEGIIIVKPIAILGKRWILRNGTRKLQALIQWENMKAEEATWVEWEEFQQTYPSHNLEDKVPFKDGSDDKGIIVYKRRST